MGVGIAPESILGVTSSWQSAFNATMAESLFSKREGRDESGGKQKAEIESRGN